MNFIQRAIKNVTRKLSKTVLLVLTFFLIGNLVIIGLSVAKASETAKVLARQKMRAVVTYEIDYDKYYRDAEAIEDEDERNEFYEHYPSIVLNDVRDVIKDERVKIANSLSQEEYYKIDGGFDFVHLNNEFEQNMNQEYEYEAYAAKDYVSNGVYVPYYSYEYPSFFVKGNWLPGMIEIEDGQYSITKGRFYTQDEIDSLAKVCLITSELAATNNVGVGDTITLAYQTVDRWYAEYGITKDDVTNEYEVIGIFDHTDHILPDNSNYDYCMPSNNPDNVILMPASTMYSATLPLQQKMFDSQAQMYPEDEYYHNSENRPSMQKVDEMELWNVTLLLNDPLIVDDFVKEYEGKLGDYKKLNANNEEFKKLAKPLDTLSSYAEFIVWLVVINAVVIITLVTALTLKTREYEIGVLLSVGASKLKIVAQFFIELAIVAVIGFTLAVASGSFISKKLGYTLLDNQIQTEGLKEDEQYVDDWISPWTYDYTTEISLEDIVSEYDVTISPLLVAQIYVVGMGIVLVSVVIPSIMIMRFNPKRILMNQG